MRRNWTRDELIIAFNLYCKIDFSKTVKSNPKIIEVASLIGRTPSSVAFKLGNFGSLDPQLRARGIGGLPNISKLDRQIWEEFHDDWENLAFESESLIATLQGKSINDSLPTELSEFPDGLERAAIVKQRVNQGFFRTSILSNYNSTCCITGLKFTELLVASHIIPWSKNKGTRLNPSNGLCLNSLHDRAFDQGLVTITPDYRIKNAQTLKNSVTESFVTEYFLRYENQQISLPHKFLPDKDFLMFHNESIFER